MLAEKSGPNNLALWHPLISNAKYPVPYLMACTIIIQFRFTHFNSFSVAMVGLQDMRGIHGALHEYATVELCTYHWRSLLRCYNPLNLRGRFKQCLGTV